LKQKFDADFQWIAYPLHPETPPQGRTLENLFAGVPVDLKAMRKRLVAEAEALGLPFGDRTRTYNSRLAQELGKWAESEGRGNQFHAAAFQTYFAENANLAEIEVLVDLAVSVGLSADKARAVIRERIFRTDVDNDWQMAYEKHVRAVPTLVIGENSLVGAQPYEAMEAFLLENGIAVR